MYTECLLNRGRRGNFISLSKFTRFLLLSRANESIKKVVNIFVKKERNKCRRNCFTDSVTKTLTKKILGVSFIDRIFFPILIRKYNAFSSRDTTICETKYEQKYDQFKTLKVEAFVYISSQRWSLIFVRKNKYSRSVWKRKRKKSLWNSIIIVPY